MSMASLYNAINIEQSRVNMKKIELKGRLVNLLLMCLVSPSFPP